MSNNNQNQIKSGRVKREIKTLRWIVETLRDVAEADGLQEALFGAHAHNKAQITIMMPDVPMDLIGHVIEKLHEVLDTHRVGMMVDSITLRTVFHKKIPADIRKWSLEKTLVLNIAPIRWLRDNIVRRSVGDTLAAESLGRLTGILDAIEDELNILHFEDHVCVDPPKVIPPPVTSPLLSMDTARRVMQNFQMGVPEDMRELLPALGLIAKELKCGK